MKSLAMCLYLGAVAVGNLLVAGVNHFIQIPDSATAQFEKRIAKLPADWRDSPRTVVLPGYDGIDGTKDDLIQRVSEGIPSELGIPGQKTFDQAATSVFEQVVENRLPPNAKVNQAIKRADLKDPWGQSIRYQLLNSNQAILITPGPDKKHKTTWDIGLQLELPIPEKPKEPSWTDTLHPKESWLERKKKQLHSDKEPSDSSTAMEEGEFKTTAFSGGRNRLQGATYFHFFSGLMLLTAVLFIPYALLYKPKTWLQD